MIAQVNQSFQTCQFTTDCRRWEVEVAFWCPLESFPTELAEQLEVEWSHEMVVFRQYVEGITLRASLFSIPGLMAHIAHEVAELYQLDSM